ncbi:MAG: S-methyl-5'-thioadenosine phosphorylase [Planctomycetota bacterium]|jgi:5'-methylthioadenosine phosphorylase
MANIKVGLIGGTGLGEALGAEAGDAIEVQTPFGAPSSPIIETRWDGLDVAILQRHGEGHVLNPSFVPYRANIYALKSLGVTHIIASGATGSLREEFKPRELVIADQVIDKTCRRANTFYENAAVHVEFADPFCPVMRKWLLAAGSKLEGVSVHDGGTYVCMEGPAFSTKAESHMHRAWGGDLIGMTVMPEAKLAREAEMAYALIALPTDYDCWREHEEADKMALLTEIIGNVKEATVNSVRLIKEALTDVSVLETEASPAHKALELAIWSDKGQITKEELDRLDVLWGKYFE